MSDQASGGSEDVRRGLRKSSDPRAGRTRERLFAAAQSLCARDDEVSVSALVREAGVSRSAFYTHFADVGELALRMIEPVFEEIAATAAAARAEDPHRAMREAQEGLAAHVHADRSLYRAAFLLPGGTLLERMRDAMVVPLAAHIETVQPPEGIRADITAGYIAGAATGVLADWVTGRIDASPSTLADHLYLLMPAWMHEPTNQPSE
ncbi:TetR/AcrR family transcriptional regulator [Microbacterium sp. ZW T5_45]|uniref:TetR/AcrR family transcriptional regulator n=1 Tax=Microbacterium sp. ZW T5_45 TaxID=3378080 RepID=UPI003854C9EF